MFYRLATIALLLTASVSLNATTPNLIYTTGTSPFGFTGQPAFVMGWNQTIGYTNISVALPLADNTPTPLSGVEGTVYLMNQIGPGTTTANQVAPPVQITGLTNASSIVTLFSGLSLPPGNYYLVLVPTNVNPMSMSPQGASSANITLTMGTGVTALGAGVPSSPLAGYPPASTVTLTVGNLFFGVYGTLAPNLVAPTPAPSTLILLLTGLAGAGLWLARRKRAV